MVDGILEFVELRSPMHRHGLGFVDLLRFLVKFFPLLVCVREEFFRNSAWGRLWCVGRGYEVQI